jgi:hypothetical protein
MTPQQKSAAGLALIKESILDYLAQHPGGVRHINLVRDLGLESEYEGKHPNYLSYSVIGILLHEGSVRYERRGKWPYYFKK